VATHVLEHPKDNLRTRRIGQRPLDGSTIGAVTRCEARIFYAEAPTISRPSSVEFRRMMSTAGMKGRRGARTATRSLGT